MTNPNPESVLEEFDVEDLLVNEIEQDELAEAEYDDGVYDEDEDGWGEDDEDIDDWDDEDYEEVGSPESFEDDGVFEQLDTSQAGPTMPEILSRQDDVNAQLDELNARIENLIAEFTGKKEKAPATVKESNSPPQKHAA